MALSDRDNKILNDIFSAYLKSPKGLNAARFRADNEQIIPELDRLESLGYVQRKGTLYSIPLLALAYLAKENLFAQAIVQKCHVVFALLKGCYRDNLDEKITVNDIARGTGLSMYDVRRALTFIIQSPILGSYTSEPIRENGFVAPSESILKYQSFVDILKEREELDKPRHDKYRDSKKLAHMEQETQLSATSGKVNWEAIESEFGRTKVWFARRINFIKDPFKRTIIFRDVEQAFILASSGFSKPAVILAGGVIEELLRLYLKQQGISPQKPLKEDFNGYVKTCEDKGLLKAGISRLSDSVRHFRNLVHLSKEETKRHTISKSTAKGAVASIFTIASDF